MTTKNHSRFTATHVTVSRRDHDQVLNEDQVFLKHLFYTYHRSWSLAGVTFYDLNPEDFAKLYKLLA